MLLKCSYSEYKWLVVVPNSNLDQKSDQKLWSILVSAMLWYFVGRSLYIRVNLRFSKTLSLIQSRCLKVAPPSVAFFASCSKLLHSLLFHRICIIPDTSIPELMPMGYMLWRTAACFFFWLQASSSSSASALAFLLPTHTHEWCSHNSYYWYWTTCTWYK